MQEFKEGIIKGLNILDYHKSAGISNSGLSLLLEAPAKYYYQYLSGLATKTTTDSLDIGSAVHVLVLEPELFLEQFVVLPEGFTKYSNDNKKLWNDIIKSKRTPMKTKDFETASKMAFSIRSNKAFRAILESLGKGSVEDSLFFKHRGACLRSRPDWYCDDIIIDIKTTASAHKDDFRKSIVNFGYHRQAYISTLGLSKLTGQQFKTVLLMAVESEPPYLTANYLLTQDIIDVGGFEVEKAIDIYNQCVESDEWPGYPEEVQNIDLPYWYKRN